MKILSAKFLLNCEFENTSSYWVKKLQTDRISRISLIGRKLILSYKFFYIDIKEYKNLQY